MRKEKSNSSMKKTPPPPPGPPRSAQSMNNMVSESSPSKADKTRSAAVKSSSASDLNSSSAGEMHSRPKSKAMHRPLKNEDIDIELAVDAESKNPERKSEKREKTLSTSSATASSASAAESPKVERSKTDGAQRKSTSRFKGKNPLQYGLWAHYLALGAASLCLCMGIFAILWDDARTYECRLTKPTTDNKESIASIYQFDPTTGVCPTVYTHNGISRNICCDPNKKSSLQGYPEIGAIYIVYSIFVVIYENTSWGFGLWFPNDTFFFRNRISLIGLLHLFVGLIGLYNYATCLAAFCLVVTGIVYSYAAYRNESGDGGREAAKKAIEAARAKKDLAKADNADKSIFTVWGEQAKETCLYILSFNPVTFFRRIYNEDKLSSYIWVGIFVIVNIALFAYTLNVWYAVIDAQYQGLKDGTLNVTCDTPICKVNRKLVRYGPVSEFAPWAKSCGVCLNLNCALLLLPVVRMLLRKLNNIGESFATTQNSNDFFAKFFAHPMTRYVPLAKNIEFHKLCAGTIFMFSWGHMVFHWLNLWRANNPTLQLFRFLQWEGTDYFTGALTV